MPYYIDEEHSDILFEVNGDQVAFKESNPGSGGSGGNLPYVIQEKDATTPTDRNLFSSKRVLAEVAKGSQSLQDEYLSKKKDDRTPHLLSSDKGFEVGEFVTGESGGKVWLDAETLKVLIELDRVTARQYIDIGEARLEYDSQNQAIRVTNRATDEEGNPIASIGLYAEGFLSAKGVSSGGSAGGSASALYQLNDVLKNATEDGVQGAAKDKVLMFDGTHWYAGDAKGKVVAVKVGQEEYKPSEEGIVTLPEFAKVVDKTLTVDKFIGALEGNADTATKLKNALTIQANGTTLGIYDGSTEKTLNLTYANVGAAAASHKQAYTANECTTYTTDDNTMGVTPAAVKKAIGLFDPKEHTHNSLGTLTVGSSSHPVYFNAGVPTAVDKTATFNALINSISVGFDAPTDADYYISQYVGGGTENTTYRRRSHSALYTYIKNKAEGTWGINISGNAASATKLQNARKIWGQAFDGSADVNGALTGVTSITIGDCVITYDSANKGLKFSTGIYSEQYVSAKGANSSTGGSTGGAASIYVGSTLYTPDTEGIIHLPAYPTVPTALKSPYALTIQKNGITQGVYDGSTEKSVNITVPTKVSELTNDSNYLTAHQTLYELTIQGNETELGVYTPNAAAKSINITAAGIGAAAATHTHTIAQVTGLQESLSDKYSSTVSRTANTVLAAPNGSDGTASFRKLVAADIPSLSHKYLSVSGGVIGSETASNTAVYWSSKRSKLCIVSDGTNGNYIESGNVDFTGNSSLHITGYFGKTGSNLYLNFENIYCRASGYTNLDSGNYADYAAKKAHTHAIGDVTNLQAALDSKLNASIFTDLFEKVLLSDGVTYAIRAKYGFYSDSFVSAKSSNSEISGGGGIGSIYVGTTQYNADSEGIVRLPAYPTIPTSLKNPYALTIQANGTTLVVYDGSAAKAFNLTYANVGAAAASHKQAYTADECTTYATDDNTMGVTPAAVKKAVGLFDPKAHTHNVLGTVTAGSSSNPVYFNAGVPTACDKTATFNALVNSATIGYSTPEDADYYISQSVGGGTSVTTYHRRSHSALYAYLKGKAEGTWGINVSGYAGALYKANYITNLNSPIWGITDGYSINYNNCDSTVSNAPSGIDNANLIMNIQHGKHNTSGQYGWQVGFFHSLNAPYVRKWTGGSVGSWIKLLTSRNYNEFAPSKNGTGASGTWGISITGNSATATKLKNYYTSRPSDANFAPDGSGGMCKFLATSTMTSNKPAVDGHILHFHWDNTGGWDAQLMIPCNGNASNEPQWRAQNSGTWGSWISLVTSGTIGKYNAGSATKLQTARTIWGQSFDGTSNVSGTITGSYFKINDSSTSPYLLLNGWYVQVNNSMLQMGNAAEYSIKVDSSGNLILPTSSRRIYFNGSTSDNQCIVYDNSSGRLSVGSSAAKGFNVGDLLVSSAWADYTLVPTNGIYSKGDIYSAGAITAKASSSDIRLKRDLTEYDALSIVRGQRSVMYHWNEIAKRNSAIFDDEDWHYGLIAQELQRDHPQLVKDVFGDYLTIDYERLIPILWRAVQQLAKRNEELEQMINERRKAA